MYDKPWLPFPVILKPQKVLTLHEKITTNKDRQFTDSLDSCMLYLCVCDCEFYYVLFSNDFVRHESLNLFWANDQTADYYLDSFARPAATIRIEKCDMIREA